MMRENDARSGGVKSANSVASRSQLVLVTKNSKKPCTALRCCRVQYIQAALVPDFNIRSGFHGLYLKMFSMQSSGVLCQDVRSLKI
eukprot:8139288-Karenia_brevis.AAC.1